MLREVYKKLQLYGARTFVRFAFAETLRKWRQITKHSYSQSGEDLLLDQLTGGKKQGFYVDVGAYDPHRFSNTKRFYKLGWHGINIEPNPKRYEKFIHERTRDININLGIADTASSGSKRIAFYEFFPDTLSTFSASMAQQYQRSGHPLVSTMDVPVDTLAHVLEMHASTVPIDFLSTDTEGFDLIVLQSNDWNRFRPRVICVEATDHPLGKKIEPPKEDVFLKSVGYTKYYDNGLNSFYINSK